MTKTPTPYKDVNKVILLLLQKSQEILDENIIGMYIHGSLATDTFNRKRGSDIDFIIVLKEKIQESTILKLKEMLQEITEVMPELSKKLEGSYIPKEWLSLSQPPNDIRPYINGGKLHLYPYGYEWILEKYLIRTRGITAFGPPPDTLIKPIPQEEIKRANINILTNDWEPLLKNPDRLKDDNYQVYTVLTMCRSLFLHINGKFPSKPEAVLWVKKHFPSWKSLIESALSWHQGENFNQLEKVKAFIKFTCEFVQSSHSLGLDSNLSNI